MFREDLSPLTNYDLEEIAAKLKIKNFRGVFMRDTLPKQINKIEVGIVNLDLNKNNGTHWVCYCRKTISGRNSINSEKCYYFDSFGVDPPIELIKYLNKDIKISTFKIQKFNTHHCGYYCLLVLKLLEKYDFKDIILELI